MRWRVPFLCFAALALSLSQALATPQQDYLDIYLQLNTAERLEKSGDFRGALEGFEDCAAKLHKLRLNYPDWEHVLVNSRMEDCRAKIAELETKTDYTNPGPASTAATTSGTPGAPAPADDAALRTKLHDVEQELALTKRQLADVQEKYKNSQVEVLSLRTQLDGVNQQLAALKSSQTVDQSMGKLLADNKSLTEKLAAEQAQIKAMTSSPRSAVAKLSAQLKNMQEKLDASAAANAALTQTTSTLQQQLSQAQDDLSRANQKLAAAGPGSPDYLTIKRENEVMRGILLRELQEQSRRDGAKRLAQEEFDRLKITSRVLQEQVDILGSPMTPPTNDEERQLLASLRASPSEVAPLIEEGNHVAVTTGTPAGTNAPGVTPPDTTNALAATMPPAPSTTNALAASTPPAPAATNTPGAETNVATTTPPVSSTNTASSATDTNSVAANPPAGTTNAPSASTNLATATNAASATNVASGSTPPPTNAAPSPSTPPSVASDTNAAPSTNAPSVASDTNTAPAIPSESATNVASADTNAAPAPPVAASTNAVASATPTTDDHQPDPARYSNKPRLPDDMREVAQQATDLFKMQKYDEAAAKYQTIIDKYPESLYAWSNLGVVRSQEGKLQEAMTALQQAVKLSPNDAFSYRNLGIVYYQLNQNDAAIDALERSIALDPNNVYSHDYLGCACSQKGWQEVAEKEFRKAIEINDEFPDAHYNLAIVYAMQKPPSLELARRHYKRALELGLPKDPRLEKLLGLQADGVTSR